MSVKQGIKLFLSLMVYGGDRLRQGLRPGAARSGPGPCVVLYYHTVPDSQRGQFARQMDLLLELARPVSTDPEWPLTARRHHVAVTFDDGFASVERNAAPELRQRGIPYTIFVPSGCLGQSPQWLRHAPAVARQDRVMTGDELRQLSADPLATIGSHTANHVHLVEAGPERAATELGRSKADLEQVLGRAVDQFSYPFGARTTALDAQARGLGYRRLFASHPALAFRQAGEWLSGRVSVDPDTPPLEFRLKLLGAYRWLAALQGRRGT